MIKIAACQYQIETLADWKQYTVKIEGLAQQAKQQQAQLLILPEYAGVEAACQAYATDNELYAALQPVLPQYIAFYQQIARDYQLYIQAGTIIEETAPKQYINRAYFFGPTGTYGYQDKLQLIEFEKKQKIIQRGQQQTVFKTSLGMIGIAVCYDSEFPEIVRGLVKAGAELILVPSYTVSLAGYNRVFLSCRARAIENQCFVAVSFVVGPVTLSDTPEHPTGQAAILGPVDVGFPDDGILAQGKKDEISLVTADISFQKLTSVRRHGQVRNFEDMTGEYPSPAVCDVDLSHKGRGK